jgi:hypothetical protein
MVGGRATCLTMPSLPVATAAVRCAIQHTHVTHLPLAMTALDLRSTITGGSDHTLEHVLAPLLGRLFHAVLCSGHEPAEWKVEAYTSIQEG